MMNEINLLIPVSMPTLNLLFGVSHWKRKRIRDLLHSITENSIKGDNCSKLLLIEYYKSVNKSFSQVDLFDNIIFSELNKGVFKIIESVNTSIEIDIVHFRHRLCDVDALVPKYAIDAIVNIGAIKDDDLKHVKRVSNEQIKVPKTQLEWTEFIFKFD